MEFRKTKRLYVFTNKNRIWLNHNLRLFKEELLLKDDDFGDIMEYIKEEKVEK